MKAGVIEQGKMNNMKPLLSPEYYRKLEGRKLKSEAKLYGMYFGATFSFSLTSRSRCESECIFDPSYQVKLLALNVKRGLLFSTNCGTFTLFGI
jgi:hypothetical protein